MVAKDQKALFQAWALSSISLQLYADPGGLPATPLVALSAETPDLLANVPSVLGADAEIPVTLQ